MPYEIREEMTEGVESYCVYKMPEGGEDERLKCYTDEEKAEAYLTALRIAEAEEKSVSLHALKVLSETDDSVTVGGYGVVYGGQDLEGDTFNDKTDFMSEFSSDRMPLLYDHAMGEIKNTIGVVTKVEPKDLGLWMESEISKGKEYAKHVLELIKSGVLGYSTGSVSHLVERLEGQIKRWPIYELSLTATPAEPRTLGVDFLKQIGVTVSDVTTVTESVEGQEPKTVADDLGVGFIEELTTEDIMSEEIKTTEPQPEPEVVEVPKAEEALDIKAMISEAVRELNDEHKTESGGILTENKSPAIKKVTDMDGDHDGGDAFKHWCRTGQENYYTKAALNETTAGEGGILVPQDLYAQIIAKRDESSVPHRAGALIINTSVDSVQVPTENATGGFALTAESGTYNNSEPTFTSNAFSVFKFTNETRVTEELLADEKTNLDSFLADMWGRGLATMYNQYSILGTGSGQPGGVMVEGTAGLTFDSATTIAAAEVPELYHKLPDNYSEGAMWLCSNGVLGLLRGLQGNPFLFNPTPQGDAPYGNLYGKRVLLSAQMAGASSGNKSILVGNWSFYALVERAGLTVSRNPFLYQATGQVGFFVNARWGGGVLLAEAFQYGTQA